MHDSAGAGVATYIACAEAGADAVDTATDSLSGVTSQPSVGATLASLQGSGHEPGLDVDHIRAIDSYWAQVRLLYSPFEAGITGPDPGMCPFRQVQSHVEAVFKTLQCISPYLNALSLRRCLNGG